MIGFGPILVVIPYLTLVGTGLWLAFTFFHAVVRESVRHSPVRAGAWK
jgi:hypothetical protein